MVSSGPDDGGWREPGGRENGQDDGATSGTCHVQLSPTNVCELLT